MPFFCYDSQFSTNHCRLYSFYYTTLISQNHQAMKCKYHMHLCVHIFSESNFSAFMYRTPSYTLLLTHQNSCSVRASYSITVQAMSYFTDDLWPSMFEIILLVTGHLYLFVYPKADQSMLSQEGTLYHSSP